MEQSIYYIQLVYYKSHKISNQKFKETKIFVKDKNQSQEEGHSNILLEFLIQLFLADSIYKLHALVNN
ncbi:unnamed protein product [Paramecium pentaurelia]|uniref:Uncharacterized protein n=1 Tax=Paramecium pentaurelia TaxID=43138 RepID=A0A8S1XHT6_9CILI|nr:unnamed protein product [Paramecium pentaurelia]